MIDGLQQSLRIGFDRWAPCEGMTISAVPGLTFHRHTAPTEPYFGMMDASLSLVLTGQKAVSLGDHFFNYGQSSFLLTSIDLPVTAWVAQASAEEPYRGLLLSIDLAVVRSLMPLTEHPVSGGLAPLGAAMADVSADLLDPLLRLCDLNDRPKEIVVLCEQIRREITYRLLLSPVGPRLLAIASSEGLPRGIVRALDWLKHNFRTQLSVKALSDIAGMAESTLHRQFKSITTMSPIQYRKNLQLNEARRLMMAGGVNAASAAYAVGYESASQFSREYRRTFGQPPVTSVAEVRRRILAEPGLAHL